MSAKRTKRERARNKSFISEFQECKNRVHGVAPNHSLHQSVCYSTARLVSFRKIIDEKRVANGNGNWKTTETRRTKKRRNLSSFVLFSFGSLGVCVFLFRIFLSRIKLNSTKFAHRIQWLLWISRYSFTVHSFAKVYLSVCTPFSHSLFHLSLLPTAIRTRDG